MIKNVLVIIFILAIGYSLSAQQDADGKLKGRVFDNITKQAIPGVIIRIRELQKGTVTDTSGNFLIHSLPEGNYSIEIQSLAYETKYSTGRSLTALPLIH